MVTIVGNMKGGTGKSTVTFNLAVWWADQGRNVQLFDLDPQKTLTDVVEVRTEELYEPELPMPLDKEALEEGVEGHKEVLMDVSMSDQSALDKAILLADRIIIPIAPSQADIWSTQRFLKRIHQLRKANMPKVFGIINRADTHPFVPETKETEQAMDLLDLERIPVRLHNRAAYRRSFSEGLAVFELEPSAKASREFLKMAKHLD
jgi:chromosome partitioning protein